MTCIQSYVYILGLTLALLLGLASEAVTARQLSSEGKRGLLSSAAAGLSAGKAAVVAQSNKAQQGVPEEEEEEAAAAAAAARDRRWQNTKPSDACTPFDVAKYGHVSVDAFCAKLNSLTDDQLRELHANAPLPSSSSSSSSSGGGFPLRGCTHRCIAGSSFAALAAKMPNNNLGWGGKCFNWALNPETGVPSQLINIFSPHYDNTSLPDSLRVQGKQEARARVYYVDSSRETASRPGALTTAAQDIYDPERKSMLIVQAFNDEMREVRPGFLLGRIFLKAGAGVHELPIFFGLIQACTAGGHFPTTPAERALPPLGSP